MKLHMSWPFLRSIGNFEEVDCEQTKYPSPQMNQELSY